MNKFLTVLLIVVLSTSYAQAQFTFGLRAGLNLTNFTEKSGGYEPDVEYKYMPGFLIGVVGEYAVSDVFAIQPTILFTTHRGERKSFGKITRYVNYLQIPVNALYKVDIGRIKLLLQGGPYLSYALSGKYKWDNSLDFMPSLGPKWGENKIKFGYCECHDAAVMKPFDFGIGVGAGLQFNNFQVGLGYNFGLTNLSSRPKDDDHSLKSNGLALTLTYLFGKRNQKE
jgi:hypothetical protein